MKKCSCFHRRILAGAILVALFGLSLPLPWQQGVALAQEPPIEATSPPVTDVPPPPEPRAPAPAPEPAPVPLPAPQPDPAPPAPEPSPEPPAPEPAAPETPVSPPAQPEPRAPVTPAPLPPAIQQALAPSFTIPVPAAPRGPSKELLEGRSALEQARQALEALRAELDALAQEVAEADELWQESQTQLERARLETAAARKEFQRIQTLLGERARALYMSRAGYDAALAEAVLNSDGSLNQVMDRVDRVLRFLKRDQNLFDQAEKHLARLTELTADLAAKEKEAAARLADVQDAKMKAVEALEASEAEYEALRERVRLLEEKEEAERRAAEMAAGQMQSLSSAAGTPLMTYQAVNSPGWVFPVQGPNSYINDWGFPRSGGRTHKGTDIFSPRDTPVVAVIDGVVSKSSPLERGLGGITVWLRGDDGNSYYYAHLENIAGGIAPGVRVKAGQVLGTVGDSGNARTTPTHLHFEIHPGGGSAINPFPTLTLYRY